MTGLFNLPKGAEPYTFTVVATTSAGTSPPSAPSAGVWPALPVAAKPAPPKRITVGSVSYTGTLKVGLKLRARVRSVSPAGTRRTYRWYRATKPIPRATKATYTLRRADRGKRIRVRVTIAKAGYPTVTKSFRRLVRVRR